MFHKSVSKLQLVDNDQFDTHSVDLAPDPETDYESVIYASQYREEGENTLRDNSNIVKDLARKLDERNICMLPDVTYGTGPGDGNTEKRQKLRFSCPEKTKTQFEESVPKYSRDVTENVPKYPRDLSENVSKYPRDETENVPKYPRDEAQTGNERKGRDNPKKRKKKERRKAMRNATNIEYSSDSETSSTEEECFRTYRRKLQGRELNELDCALREFEPSKKRGYLNITVDQLNKLIKEKITSAINSKNKKDDIELVNRNCNFILPDHDSTDTETMQSGMSYSSANSADNLLPVKSKVKSGTMHLVHPSRVGILKRFLPYVNGDDMTSTNSSMETSETFLSNNRHVNRRKSLQPELLRTLQSRPQDSVLHQQSNVLTGTNRLNHWKPFDVESSLMYGDCVNSNCCSSKRNKSYHFHDDSTHHCDDHHLYQDYCQNDHPKSSQQQQCCRRNARRPTPYNCCHGDERPQYGQHDPHSIHPNHHSNSQMGINHPTFASPPMMQQLPMPVMVSAPPPPTIAINQPEAQINQAHSDMLKQLQEAIAGQKDSEQAEKDTKGTENTQVSSIREILAARKKKEAELKPVRIARILSVVTIVFLVLCGAGILGLGVWNMIDENISMYTSVTKADKSDKSFQYFCYGLCFVGFVPVALMFCGCCGAIKEKGTCVKMFGIGGVVALVVNVILFVVLFVTSGSSAGIPLLTVMSSGILDNVKQHMFDSIKHTYLDESYVATAWDTLQVKAECCGCESPDDYKASAWKNATKDKKQQIPNSCCVLTDKNPADPVPSNKLLCHSLTTGFWHKQGCFEVIKAWYEQSSMMILGVIGGLLLIEVLCVIFAFRLFKILAARDKKAEESKKAKKKQSVKSISN